MRSGWVDGGLGDSLGPDTVLQSFHLGLNLLQ